MYIIRLTDNAESDLNESYKWYENQKINLGVEFIKTINRTIELIKENPFLYKSVYKNVRKAKINKFPFNIYYLITPQFNQIDIFGILHDSRNPLIWKTRI